MPNQQDTDGWLRPYGQWWTPACCIETDRERTQAIAGNFQNDQVPEEQYQPLHVERTEKPYRLHWHEASVRRFRNVGVGQCRTDRETALTQRLNADIRQIIVKPV